MSMSNSVGRAALRLVVVTALGFIAANVSVSRADARGRIPVTCTPATDRACLVSSGANTGYKCGSGTPCTTCCSSTPAYICSDNGQQVTNYQDFNCSGGDES